MKRAGMNSSRAIRPSKDATLKRVVAQWAENVDRLVREWRHSGDLPWLYTERALLSVMAAGIWQLGGTAFEEYRAEKSLADRTAKTFGREDLHFSLGRRSFKAEAKHLWSPATRLSPMRPERLQHRLAAAVADVRRCQATGEERLGVLFAAPYVRKRHAASLDAHVDRWLDGVFNRVPCIAAAATFPLSVRTTCFWSGDDFAYPGAAIFIARS
jgi:hypothetical protein